MKATPASITVEHGYGDAVPTVSLTIERIDRDGSLFGRLFGGILGGRSAGARGVTWKAPIPASGRTAEGRWGNAVRIPTNALEPGEYVLAVEVGGISAIAPVTKRSLTVQRPPR